MTRILFLLFWITLLAGCAGTGGGFGADVSRSVSSAAGVMDIKTAFVSTKSVVSMSSVSWYKDPNELPRRDMSGWEPMVRRALEVEGEDLMFLDPADVGEWCVAYGFIAPSKRIDFWSGLIVELMSYESSYEPKTFYTEGFQDSTGANVVSRGLLQISKESANGYGCGISDAQQLHDPWTNLTCGVKIMSSLVEKDNKISGRSNDKSWQGLARYWAPFRNDTKRTRMKDELKYSSLCRL